MIKKYSKMFEGKDKFPNYRTLEVDGFTIHIGKDAKSNDYLTFNIAKENDLWFHAKGVPGSHLVIVVGDKVPSIEVIKKVAELAKTNSKAKGKENSPIVYCKRMFVRKGSEMNDGQVAVDYKNANEISI